MFNFGDIGGMLKNLRQMQVKMKELQETLEAQEVEGAAGGGAVSVRANGRGTVLGVRIDPSAVDAANVELLEDMVAAAVRQAAEKAQELSRQELQKLTGGLNIPGLENILGSL